jgi:hypothetical protein
VSKVPKPPPIKPVGHPRRYVEFSVSFDGWVNAVLTEVDVALGTREVVAVRALPYSHRLGRRFSEELDWADPELHPAMLKYDFGKSRSRAGMWQEIIDSIVDTHRIQ